MGNLNMYLINNFLIISKPFITMKKLKKKQKRTQKKKKKKQIRTQKKKKKNKYVRKRKEKYKWKTNGKHKEKVKQKTATPNIKFILQLIHSRYHLRLHLLQSYYVFL